MRALWRAGSGSILKLKFSRSASTWATTLWHLSGSGQSAGRGPRQGHRLQVTSTTDAGGEVIPCGDRKHNQAGDEPWTLTAD